MTYDPKGGNQRGTRSYSAGGAGESAAGAGQLCLRTGLVAPRATMARCPRRRLTPPLRRTVSGAVAA